MFLILAPGIALWIVYGSLLGDVVINLANSVSLRLLSGILYFELREEYGAGARGMRANPETLKRAGQKSAPLMLYGVPKAF